MDSDGPKPEMLVGIFWLVQGQLIFDTTAISEAEPYGDLLGHSRSHIRFWESLKLTGAVPPETEYDEFPRGRVMANPKTHQTFVLLDDCIRRNSWFVSEIMRVMHLPENAVLDRDLHYRCPECLYGPAPADEDY
jgi:hypothetical protein